ncbi:hypothetical protein LWC08_15145 (plasmid) [Desulfobaculum bizertense]|uniref:hypothetical protein n=1 Tax=Desulfobaculum bizertense TaxID=376490 RepID=UPI001F3CF60D|nr:hypothetical protein [Desulfobaculum bizertense]UIJ39541.1 hypothetical protein LWC08_15145 [Desulfobaculum bizertense]
MSDHPNTNYDPDVEFGKASVIKKGTKATIVVVSILLDSVMEACKDLDVTILYYTTLEPFDYETLAKNSPSNKILICEPHFEGSLLYDIHKGLPDRFLMIKHVAFPREIFRNYGSYSEKVNYYKLTSQNIREQAQFLIEAKS